MESCPAARKIEYPGEEYAPAVERLGKVWHVRSHDLGREILRQTDGFQQAGFNAEQLNSHLNRIRDPILYARGAAHRDQRAKVARYFAPKTLNSEYAQMVEQTAEKYLAAAKGDSCDFSQLALDFSVEVTATVMGLSTADVPGLGRRLMSLVQMPVYKAGESIGVIKLAPYLLRGQQVLGMFWWREVRPAVLERRKQPQDDVVSHLISCGYSMPEIVTECVMYGVAGMVTTREFLQAALWHLLTNDQLRADYRAGDVATRHALLLELLRIEPVVGHILRRATTDHQLQVGGVSYDIREGELVDIYVRASNVDSTAVGADPFAVCPSRKMRAGVRPEGLSFGDGPHRCVGYHLALLETERLLSMLLEHEVTLVQAPRIEWAEMVAGYELQDMRIRIS